MAISSVTLQNGVFARAPRLAARRWNEATFHLLAAVGAMAVIAGSYMTWATFYAGLVERNGLSGHGKYFIALAIGALIAAALSSKRGLAPLRLLVPAAGGIVFALALRDLRNLHALTGDPAAAFYVPGEGPGLYIVLAGAALMIGAFFASTHLREWRSSALADVAIAGTFIAGAMMFIAGAYGEYYLHFAGAHAHDHADAMHPAHLLTLAGASLLFATFSAIVYRLGARHRAPVAARSHDVRAADV
jgi:hypothetical protein